MYVEAAMSSPVVTLGPQATSEEAARLMRTRRFRHLPVVAGGRLVGIVSDRDVAAADARPIERVMRREVITVARDLPVEGAALLLLEHKIGCLPVLNDAGRVVGIATASDLFALLARLVGGQGPSTRLRLRCTDLPKQLALVAWLAHEHHLPITTLLTEPDDGTATGRTVVVRVGTIDAGAFVASLQAAGLRVDAPDRRLADEDDLGA